MSFWDTFGKVEDELHRVDPFYQTMKHVEPYLPNVLTPADTKYREHLRTTKNKVHQETVNNPAEPEQTQAQKINNFVEHNKVMIGGSFALLIIFLLLR